MLRNIRGSVVWKVLNLAARMDTAVSDVVCRVKGHEWRKLRYNPWNGGERVWLICGRCGRREEA